MRLRPAQPSLRVRKLSYTIPVHFARRSRSFCGTFFAPRCVWSPLPACKGAAMHSPGPDAAPPLRPQGRGKGCAAVRQTFPPARQVPSSPAPGTAATVNGAAVAAARPAKLSSRAGERKRKMRQTSPPARQAPSSPAPGTAATVNGAAKAAPFTAKLSSQAGERKQAVRRTFPPVRQAPSSPAPGTAATVNGAAKAAPFR